MKNKVIFGVFLMIIMSLVAAPALATKAVNITTPSLYIQGNDGVQTVNFTVANIGDEAINVSLTDADPSTGSRTVPTSLQSSSITLSIGASTTVQLHANLTKAYMGVYMGSVTAQIPDVPPFGQVTSTMPVTVNVTDNSLGLAAATPAAVYSYTDATFTQPITVTNYANKDITANVVGAGYTTMGSFVLDKSGSQVFPAYSVTTITPTVLVPAGLASGTYWGSVSLTYGSTVSIVNLQANVYETKKISVNAVSMTNVDPGSIASVAFSINNMGNTNLTGLSLSNYTILDSNGNKINLTFSPSTGISIGKGLSAVVTAKADVSSKINTGTYTQAVIVSGDGTSAAFNVGVTVNSLLKITDINVDPDTVKPGQDFEVEVTVENQAEDIDMKSVTLDIKIMDGSKILQDINDDDMKDNYDVGKLNNGADDKYVFKFTMPYTVDDTDTFKIVVEANGKNADDSTVKYYDKDEDSIVSAERDDREVQIYKSEFDSSTLSCQRVTYINLGFRNIGKDDESGVLRITSDTLGLQETDDFDLSTDPNSDEFEVEKSYQLDFSSAPEGVYPIKIRLDNTDNKKLAEKTISITVQDCTGSIAPATTTTSTQPPSGTQPTSTGTTGQAVNVQYTSGTPSAATGSLVRAAPVTSTQVKSSSSLTSNPLFIVALALGNLALILLIVFAATYAFGGKKKTDDFDL